MPRANVLKSSGRLQLDLLSRLLCKGVGQMPQPALDLFRMIEEKCKRRPGSNSVKEHNHGILGYFDYNKKIITVKFSEGNLKIILQR